MQNIEFDNEKFVPLYRPEESISPMARLVIKLSRGLIKTRGQASFALSIIAIVFFILSIIIFASA